MSSASPTPAERVLAAAIYAPIGLGAKVIDDLPDVAAKARQQIVFARFIGKMAVDQCARELRDRLDGLANPAPASPAGTAVPQQRKPVPRADDVVADATESRASTASTESTASTASTVSPQPDDLALPDYDQLPAAHIVGKLGGLSSSELDAIEAYESAHRHRRTVLGKISQLRGA